MKKPQISTSFTGIVFSVVDKLRNELLLYGIAESVLLIILLVAEPDVEGLRPLVYTLAILIPLIAIIHFFSTYSRLNQVKESVVSNELSPLMMVFSQSQSIEFYSHLSELMEEARHIVLIGIGLNILYRDPLTISVMERAANGDCNLEIFLANPNSPDVHVRLIEEELGDTKPSVGKKGLLTRRRNSSFIKQHT